MPEIYLGCRIKTAEIKIHKNGWLNQNRWYLYSAYEDKRYNSLYPRLWTSVQVGFNEIFCDVILIVLKDYLLKEEIVNWKVINWNVIFVMRILKTDKIDGNF